MTMFLKILFVLLLASHNSFSQAASVIKFPELETIMASDKGDIRVINFWATWCGPCVKELPEFEKLKQKHPIGLEVFLVSLDFVEKVDRVNSFITTQKLKSTVLLLDEIDYDSWINRVDESWSGAIPATLFINTKTGKRKLVAKELQLDDLEKIIAEIKKN